ncbi:C1 family peptidase [Streptomyces sp. LP11]|uniref:C1 family peptidase n=1 Tax=Streptomyces pyxinicus TaxID=2970331 RepID=A0ABT2B6A2_9ACTN|nr:C1 family peptidase [Streptomyces sp. LP11]MCS0603630.1 C1 family peptidase [Streptomyces sp. LP11]
MRSHIAVGVTAALALSCMTAATATAAEKTVAPHTQHDGHGFGLNLKALHGKHTLTRVERHGAKPVTLRLGSTAPASADLTRYALTPGDQGQVGSCVAWATGYSAYGILMNEQGISGAPMAPMYVYAQIARGNDQGTLASVALPMEQKQGIDTKEDYWQGDFDYTTQPDSDERANAAHYTLSGYDKLPTKGSSARTAIQNALSQGEPVVIGFQAHQSFRSLNSQNASNYSYLPGNSSSDKVIGGHEVTIVGYNSQGVKIENSWGTRWGAGGFFTVPWKFFDTGDVMEAHAVGALNS